jgi:TPR repeat protein
MKLFKLQTQAGPLSLLLTMLLAGSLCLPAFAADVPDLRAGQLAFNAGDYEQSFALWQTLATQGHADAQLLVGLSYANGWGTEKSASLAEIWYRKAALNNNAAAQFLLGLRYISDGEDKMATGLMWLRKAAENGDDSAQRFLKKAQSRGWFRDMEPAEKESPSASQLSQASHGPTQAVALAD